jgi:putative addiction module component (TIGR02574 family)
MADPVRIIEEAALKLGEKERAELARVLILSLDGPEEPADEAVWAEEAERRYRELASGSIEAIPSERVLDEARSRLR